MTRYVLQLAVWPTATAMAAALCEGAGDDDVDQQQQQQQQHVWLSQFSYLPAALRKVRFLCKSITCHT